MVLDSIKYERLMVLHTPGTVLLQQIDPSHREIHSKIFRGYPLVTSLLTLTRGKVLRNGRLLHRVDAEIVVVLDSDPGTDVLADITGEGRNPFGNVCIDMAMSARHSQRENAQSYLCRPWTCWYWQTLQLAGAE